MGLPVENLTMILSCVVPGELPQLCRFCSQNMVGNKLKTGKAFEGGLSRAGAGNKGPEGAKLAGKTGPGRR